MPCFNVDPMLQYVHCYAVFVANLTDEQKRWFIDYYKKICRLGVKDADRPNHRDNEIEPPANKQDVRSSAFVHVQYSFCLLIKKKSR